MLKLEWIRTLAEVYRLESFTAVAQSRGVSAMAISKQITQLESQVGEALLNRSKRKVNLTEAGTSLLEKSQRLLAEHDALNDWVDERNREPAGVLKVVILEAAILRYTITPWLGEFLQKYPKVELDIKTGSEIEGFPNLQADIYWGFGVYLGQLMPGLKRKELLTTRYGIYASAHYLEQFGTPKNIADLKHHYVIGNSHNSPQNALIVKGGGDFQNELLEGLYLKTKITTDASSLELAVQGLGLTNYSEVLIKQIQVERNIHLVPVMKDHWIEDLEVFVYFHQTKLEQPKVRAFLDFFYAKRSAWL